MTQDDSSTKDTQARLLESAAEIFAAKGYRDATIAEICEGAGANVAAVNYYFRSKENLYAEAWDLAFRRSLEAHPLDGGVAPDAPAEERLRGHVFAIVRRITDPRSHEFDIIHKEHANPTGLLAEIVRESIRPVRERMAAIVRELLGERASERQVTLCQRSIMAQCLHVMLRRRHGEKVLGVADEEFGVEEMAEHIVQFSLAGIRDIRRRIEDGQAGGQESGGG